MKRGDLGLDAGLRNGLCTHTIGVPPSLIVSSQGVYSSSFHGPPMCPRCPQYPQEFLVEVQEMVKYEILQCFGHE